MYPKTRGRVLAKTNPRERKSGRGLRGLERSGKERICKGKPRDPVSVSEGRRSVSFLFRPRNGPPAQRINNEPDILIRGGKRSRASRKNVFFIVFTREDGSVSLDKFVILRYFYFRCVSGGFILFAIFHFENLRIFGMGGSNEMFILDNF